MTNRLTGVVIFDNGGRRAVATPAAMNYRWLLQMLAQHMPQGSEQGRWTVLGEDDGVDAYARRIQEARRKQPQIQEPGCLTRLLLPILIPGKAGLDFRE
jgi:hypothetical protein